MSEKSERPILFSAPMVRAILEDRKTQTRRIVKNPEEYGCQLPCANAIGGPYGKAGDLLWVKETHRLLSCECRETCWTPEHVWYEADQSGYEGASLEKRRPSIFMPRWASRITLEITGVRVKRLNDISGEDAVAEGIEERKGQGIGRYRDYTNDTLVWPLAIDSYRTLWDSIHGKDSWKLNPWVWILEFRKIKPLAT
jgi:hypothetical protein